MLSHCLNLYRRTAVKGQKHKIRKNRVRSTSDYSHDSENEFDDDYYDFESDEYYDRNYSDDWEYDHDQEDYRSFDRRSPDERIEEHYSTRRSKRKRKNKHTELDFN